MNDEKHYPDDFANRYESAFARLQVSVETACARHDLPWPGRVAAAVRVALQLAQSDPDAARVLVSESMEVRVPGRQPYVRLLVHFAALLRIGAPPNPLRPGLVEQGLVGAIAAIVADELRAGRAEALPALAPELIELTLVAYLDPSEARRWAGS